MKVIFLALAFPKMNNTKYLYFGLITEFHENGHDVTVVAPAYDPDITGVQIENGINVIRVKTLPLFNVGMIKKGIANIMLPHQYKKAIKRHNLELDYDLILMPTPPISLYGVAAWLKKKSGAKTYLILRDIFPQNAVDLGLMSQGGLIHSYFRKKEKKLYAISDRIGCMSQGNITYILKHNPTLPAEKLHPLPNWSDIIPLASEDSVDELRKKEGFENAFIAIFGGNIGLPQKLENIVALAEACQDLNDVLFLIMGKGNERKNIEELIAAKNLVNIQIRDGVPQEDYMKWVQMADIGLISLSENFTIPNIPSKSLSYFNSKTPILASIDMNTDYGQLLEDLNVGLWAEAGNTALLKQKFLMLYKDPESRKTMGENGWNYMKNNLSSAHAYNKVIHEIGYNEDIDTQNQIKQ